MNIGIIGYGSMGKMLFEKFQAAGYKNVFIVSLNGSVSFSSMEKILNHKMAKVIPSVTAEINRSQTLVCYNQLVKEDDKTALKELLQSIGTVIELPETEMGMGSELVSCMPGFLASIFDVICQAAKEHTAITENQITVVKNVRKLSDLTMSVLMAKAILMD